VIYEAQFYVMEYRGLSSVYLTEEPGRTIYRN
jgi:hypothetical protein